jgi:hypothetical protein
MSAATSTCGTKPVWVAIRTRVFSHFLDLVIITGNVAVLGALLVSEACFRKWVPEGREQPVHLKAATLLGLIASGAIGLWLDSTRGEQTSIVLYPFGILPVLLASRKGLRRVAERVEWQVPAVALVAVLFTLLHAALQYFYEPSNTGAPSALFLPLWLASLGFLVWDAYPRKGRSHERAKTQTLQ